MLGVFLIHHHRALILIGHAVILIGSIDIPLHSDAAHGRVCIAEKLSLLELRLGPVDGCHLGVAHDATSVTLEAYI